MKKYIKQILNGEQGTIMNLDNELKLAKLAAKNAGIFLIKEKVSLSKTIYSQQKDIKLGTLFLLLYALLYD